MTDKKMYAHVAVIRVQSYRTLNAEEVLAHIVKTANIDNVVC